MNQQQFQELMKKSKPVYAPPTLFGFTHREVILVCVAVVAVIIALS